MLERVIHVDGLLTALCARNVERALLKMPGVHHAAADYLNSTATVHYDETQVTLAQLQAAVADCGYVCASEALPNHMAHAPSAAPAAPFDHSIHAGHVAAPTRPVDHSAHAGHSATISDAAASTPPIDHSAHAATCR